MSWYATREEAAKACKEKATEFKEEFIVLEDRVCPNCYWAQRKSSLKQ